MKGGNVCDIIILSLCKVRRDFPDFLRKNNKSKNNSTTEKIDTFT